MAATKISVLVVLTFVVAAALAANQDCNQVIGDKTFSIRNLCDKTFNLFYTTDRGRSDCVTGKTVCNEDGTVVMTTKYYVNGRLNESYRILNQDVGPGQVLRTNLENPSQVPVTLIVLSYTEIEGGIFKLACMLCWTNKMDPFLKFIAANYVKPDFSDELKTAKNIFPRAPNLNLLPNTCVAKDSF